MCATHINSHQGVRKALRYIAKLWIFGALVAHADQSFAQTIDGPQPYIEMALQYNPSLRAAESELSKAREELDYAKRLRFPALSVQLESQAQRAAHVVSVEQPLWTGGRITASIVGAEHRQTLREASLHEQRRDLALKVVNAWQQLAIALEREAALKRAEVTLQRFVDLMRRRVDAEISPGYELALVRARTGQNQIDAATAQEQRNAALYQLDQMLGTRMDRELSPLSLAQASTSAESAMRISASSDDEAANISPTVRRYRAEAAALLADYELAQARQLPEVYFKAQTSRELSRYSRTEGTVYLGLRYSPGAGFASRQQSRAALAAAETARYMATQAELDAAQSVLAEKNLLSQTLLRLNSLVPTYQAKEIVAASYERQFVAGRKSWQETLDALRELSQTETALIEAKVTAVASGARLRLRTTGLP